MALAATFLGGAKSRLLPAVIPFRFFGAAVFFHLLAWLVLLAGANAVPSFAGGLSLPLAAMHLVTLGVLCMTAIGASLQLLPVATRQAVNSQQWPLLIWWLYTPGVAAIATAMAVGAPWLLAVGALTVALTLVAVAILLARNLLGARGMPVVVIHGWAALASLIVMLAGAAGLALAYLGYSPVGRSAAMALHLAFTGYGFMGMLVLGFSYILVPMFALADAPAQRPALASAALAIAGLLLAGIAAWAPAAQALRVTAIAAGGAALAVHVALMTVALRRGMRRDLGRPFVLVRVGWGCLAASLLVALAMVLDWRVDRMPALFGVLLIGGLLSFLLGMLSRIVPFLAAMHAGTGRRPPMPSALTAQRPLDIHFACHLGALALLLGAVAADSVWLVRAAALIGACGALAFAGFFVLAWLRMKGSGLSANTAQEA
jgi:hypothetical protein